LYTNIDKKCLFVHVYMNMVCASLFAWRIGFAAATPDR